MRSTEQNIIRNSFKLFKQDIPRGMSQYQATRAASTLMHSALKTIGCPQNLLGDFSYPPTNDEYIIQFELMLALLSVLYKLPDDKYHGFRLRATGRFFSHQSVIGEVPRHVFIESLYDGGAMVPNNVSVFLGYLDKLDCQNFKQPLLDFVQRNNFNITQGQHDQVKKKTSHHKALICLALIAALFFTILSLAGVGLFVGYTSDTAPIVSTEYFNDSYTGAPICYDSFDTKLVQVTTNSTGFSADLFLVPESDIVYERYTFPEKKLRSLKDIDIIESIAFGYPDFDDDHRPLYSNVKAGVISYRINLKSSYQSDCYIKVFLYDLYDRYRNKFNYPSTSNDGSIAHSDCIDVGNSTVNLTLIPNKPILIAAFTNKYEVLLDAYAMVELTQVNTSRLSSSCTVSSSNPCNINFSRYPVRNTRECILITSHGAGSVSLTSVTLSLNGVKLIGISSIGLFGSIAAVLIFLVVFLCVKRNCTRRKNYEPLADLSNANGIQ
ncbi:PREDICTED: uncharacterized protein LOC109582056 isoform X2 [Amphimedon queenslandica]|uniref:Uncharacterized protein n=1 Tax=Amphimedon queenslandica TaxID=400682 RepID=A0AAN0J668_AMPQE|nr:PREDICTED: uncharacterized protein LOC109582056 isoform X2 [Amphimedon queenslandica]|eukprot:XP_019852183.1 PREDICTED: uncharacterized protein LOC109582056 isoform X2 [Amphimedon queenslandica]